MSHINLIIIGAHSNENYDGYNNPKQADISDLIFFKENMKNKSYSVKITCIDPMYNKYESHSSYEFIEFKKEMYKLGDTELLSKDSHNIIIEFCNMLDENYINYGENNDQYKNMIKYKDYKLTWISCGCMWNKYFPQKVLETVILSKYYTPIIQDKDSYDSAIEITQKIKQMPLFFQEMMRPYSQGIYQNLGTLYWRGCETDDYKSENILKEVFSNIEIPEEMNRFLKNEIHWNMLTRKTREWATQYVYGNNIIINS